MNLLGKMAVLFAYMMIGYFCSRRNYLDARASKVISFLVLNFASPALVISGTINRQGDVPGGLFPTVLAAVCLFGGMFAVAFLLPVLLRVPVGQRGVYRLMTIFSNIGFMGFPVVQALYGEEALLHTAIFQIPYNLLIYTYGIYELTGNQKGENGAGFEWKKMINVGVAAGLLAILLYILRWDAPGFVRETLSGLGSLTELLAPCCREGAAIHMTNDGHIAAFTAAAELAFDREPDFSGGVIAHTLGTDFGVGYLLGDGHIPEMPVELYDFLLDLGSFPQRRQPPEDLRSTRNENSGLPGARRYLGQAAAFRLAYDADPALLAGFTEERGGVLAIRRQPEDMRKACLAHLMAQAADGNAAAQAVFRQIGQNVGQISREMALLMCPQTDTRYLFGRFVKHPACFRLLQEGCRESLPTLRLEAADEDLMCTPLMRALPGHGVTVAQFGQAVGAMYYAAMA